MQKEENIDFSDKCHIGYLLTGPHYIACQGEVKNLGNPISCRMHVNNVFTDSKSYGGIFYFAYTLLPYCHPNRKK